MRDTTPKRVSKDNPSGSFLLRIWSESREVDGEPPRVRVFLRNLKTGEEHYLGDLDQLGEAVLRQFPVTDVLTDEPKHESGPVGRPAGRSAGAGGT
jgi:hypothetical protein